MRTRSLAVLAVMAGAGLVRVSPAMAAADAPFDFNGDGRSDLVVGVALEDGAATTDSGAFHVLAGTGAGVRARGSQFWTEDSPSVPDTSENGDRFGDAFASGDFDNDGFDDLAVGAPCELVAAVACAGQLTVLYGSPFGLTTDWVAGIHQDTSGIAGVAEADDQFGATLAAGDFDGDGDDDLAIGVPGEGVGANGHAGVVHVLRGGGRGLTTDGSTVIQQESVGLASEADDGFGAALAAADFDGDGKHDLVIGAPGEDGTAADTGEITVIPGAASGPAPGEAATFHQDTIGVPGRAEAGDGFGAVLAAGDFDGDDNDDLAVGVPDEAIGGIAAAGAVHLFAGSDDGLTASDSRAIWQGSGMRGGSESGDRAGAALAAGDFDGDGKHDLAVGVPGETYSGFAQAGQVLVMKGTATGINVVGTTTWNQDVSGIADVPEDGDGFGVSLAAGDFDGDGRSDLAVGVKETLEAVVLGGAVHVLFGSAAGMTAEGDQFFTQDSASVADSAEAGDEFGRSLA